MIEVFKKNYPKLSELVSETNKLIDQTNLIVDIEEYPDGQLSIQTDQNEHDWKRGVGKSNQNPPSWEYSFDKIQTVLKDTVFEHYLKWLEVPVFRTRLMICRPKSCYSFHKDHSPRLHLPIFTNDQCRFVFSYPPKISHMPADGTVFWVDTRKEHTFVNGSLEPRAHLVSVLK